MKRDNLWFPWSKFDNTRLKWIWLKTRVPFENDSKFEKNSNDTIKGLNKTWDQLY